MKKLLGMLVVLGLSLSLSSTAFSAENLIVNGGFESPVVTTWDTFDTGTPGLGWSVDYVNSASGVGRLEIQRNVAGAPHSGYQHAELDSYHSTEIYQDIQTGYGYEYEVSYCWSPRPNRADNHIEVYWNDELLDSHQGSGGSITS